jgi:hypothetical protein
MDMAYAATDVVVSRAGSVACTEILVTGKPAILVSYISSTYLLCNPICFNICTLFFFLWTTERNLMDLCRAQTTSSMFNNWHMLTLRHYRKNMLTLRIDLFCVKETLRCSVNKFDFVSRVKAQCLGPSHALCCRCRQQRRYPPWWCCHGPRSPPLLFQVKTHGPPCWAEQR